MIQFQNVFLISPAPKESPYPSTVPPCFTASLGPGIHSSTFSLTGLFWTFPSKWDHRMCGFPGLASFAWHSVLRLHMPCGLHQYFISFHTWIIFHFTFIHSSTNGHLGCFHILAVRYNFVWTFVFTFLHESVFQSLGWIPGVELLVHMFTPWLTFGELPDYFPKLLHHLKFPPQCMRAPTSPCPC